MDACSEYLNWQEVSLHQYFGFLFAEKYEEYLDWDRIWQNEHLYWKLTEAALERFLPHLTADGWRCISARQRLTEAFIRRHKDDLDWGSLCFHQRLREDFIEEMESYVFWEEIGCYQELSEAFILRHLPQLYAEDVLSDRELSIEFYQRLMELQEEAEE